MLRRYLRLTTLFAYPAIATLAACSKGAVAPPEPTHPTCVFTNPVAVGADPWVVKQGASYYYIQSQGLGISVSKSTKLSEVVTNPVQVWTAPDTGWNSSNVWAPELHYIDGKWYIYYAAGRSGPPYITQRAGVLEAVTDDPQGAYVDKGMLYTGDDITSHTNELWAIDLTVDRIGSQLYAIWSGWDVNAATDRTQQNLYIAKMSNPWTISSNRVKISAPVESWERGTELDLEEGPEFLQHAGNYFVVYSTKESWLKDYRLGELKLSSAAADPMNPASWIKSGPVFVGTPDVYGVGHASFTVSPDATEDWIVYHSKISVTPGWDRVVRMQKFGWNADGSPNFGSPSPAGQTMARPSGDCS